MISVKPDPAHPRGGYAEVSLPAANLAADTTDIAVFDNYSELYLGDAGWQPTKEMFGPYEVVRDGDHARFVIGPEIVNQIEEYANVKLIVGTTKQDISWPDEVVPAPGAAKIGGIMGTALKPQQAKGTLTAKMPDPDPKPEPAAPVNPIVPEPTPEPIIPEKSGKGGLMAGLLLLAVLLAGAVYWFVLRQEPPVEVVEPAPVVAPEPQAPDPCGVTQLTALPDFTAQATALRGCGAQASADVALGLVERAAAGGDAQALLLFGTVYDGEVQDTVMEDEIGLTFGDVPATAAEYYSRAAAAGSTEAADALAALCLRMAEMTDTLAQGAVTDYCGN